MKQKNKGFSMKKLLVALFLFSGLSYAKSNEEKCLDIAAEPYVCTKEILLSRQMADKLGELEDEICADPTYCPSELLEQNPEWVGQAQKYESAHQAITTCTDKFVDLCARTFNRK